MHGFTENYISVELPAATASQEYDNQIVKVRLERFNHDKTAVIGRLDV